jgi:hypothetical protein
VQAESSQSEAAGALFGAEPDPEELLAELPWWLKDDPRPRKKSRFVGAISPSRLRLAQTCGAKYYWRYEKKRYEPSGPAATVGKLVHGAYEDAGQRRLNPPRGKERPPRVASVAELLFLLEHQEAQLMREGDDDMVVTGAMYEEAREIIATSGPKDFSHTVGTEENVKVFLPGKAYRVGGKIDRLDLIGGSSINDPRKVVVVDYKTDREEWSKDKLENDPQPAIYLIWAVRNYPHAEEYWFCLDLVRIGRRQWVRWTPGYQAKLVSRISATVNLYKSGAATPRVGDHCKWCSYREGDARFPACKAYLDFIQSRRQPERHEGGFDGLDLPTLLRMYRESHVAFKLHEQRKKDLKGVVLDRLGMKKTYDQGIYTATVSYDRRRSYPTPHGLIKDLAPVLGVPEGHLVEDLCRIKNENLKALVGGLEGDTKKKAERVVADRESISLTDAKLTVRKKKAPW